jgi:hypothetical protein
VERAGFRVAAVGRVGPQVSRRVGLQVARRVESQVAERAGRAGCPREAPRAMGARVSNLLAATSARCLHAPRIPTVAHGNASTGFASPCLVRTMRNASLEEWRTNAVETQVPIIRIAQDAHKPVIAATLLWAFKPVARAVFAVAAAMRTVPVPVLQNADLSASAVVPPTSIAVHQRRPAAIRSQPCANSAERMMIARVTR